MILVDSHCHLDCLENSDDVAKVLQRAEQRNVHYFLCVCITQSDFKKMYDHTVRYPNVYFSIGTHPNEILATEPSMAEMTVLANSPKVVAIGETGLDYFRTKGDTTWQQNRFRCHIQVAKETKKPLIVHSRQAREDTIRILIEENARDIGGVLHCFTENWEMARTAIDLNFYISFSGIITFPNAEPLREVVKQVPLDRMLIETDSPYLAPVPFRGKQNEPAYVRHVAEKIAEIKKESLETIAQHTTQNFFNLFSQARML